MRTAHFASLTLVGAGLIIGSATPAHADGYRACERRIYESCKNLNGDHVDAIIPCMIHASNVCRGHHVRPGGVGYAHDMGSYTAAPGGVDPLSKADGRLNGGKGLQIKRPQ